MEKKCRSGCGFSLMFVFVSALLATIQLVSSQSIVRTLPGYKGDLPFKLETGYVGGGEADNVQLFYYFIESHRNPRMDPLLLWLSGGPGCSSFSALVYEIGPLYFNVQDFDGNFPTFVDNINSWTKIANVIFLDAPVGTGFSYSKDPSSYNISDTTSANQTYEFLKKWLMDHPSFLSNELYIGGDDYAGIIVPHVVQQIYDGNNAGSIPEMKLKGYILGNPVTDKHAEFNSRVKYAFLKDLLSEELYESAKIDCNGEYICVDPDNMPCMNVTRAISDVNGITYDWDGAYPEENPETLLLSAKTPVAWCRVYNYVLSYIWANDKAVQKALNVREGTIGEWVRCNTSLSYESNVQSTVDIHQDLTNTSLRSLVYSGDHDMLVTYVATLQWVRSLGMTVEEAWQPWFMEGQVAGYATKYQKDHYTMSYATVKAAGHTAPEHRPKECFAMVYRWFAHFDL